jgi:FkbM family methyltransferase
VISLKSIAAYLPAGIQFDLKRAHFRRSIRRGTFSADEPEFERLHTWVREGQTVIDVGANVGHYTRRLSVLVGHGRVIAFEPVPETFALLTANCSDLRNVTLCNWAASDRFQTVGLELPQFKSGLANYYRASITVGGSHPSLAMRLDSLPLTDLALIKIDAEGHDLAVLTGAQALIERLKPALIVEEDSAGTIAEWLVTRGYRIERLPGSPNLLGFPR